VGFGREIGAIGLKKEGTYGNFLDAGMKVAGIFKSDDPCKGDGVAQFDQFLGLGMAS
jgi:hypothetical protein